MTLFRIFDIPVFWPILLLYWLVLLFITMRRQIRHMIKYRYIPFSTGKKVYVKCCVQYTSFQLTIWQTLTVPLQRYKGSGSGAAKRSAK